MLTDPEIVWNWPFAEATHSYTARDTILYALGIGIGMEPTDERQLRFTYERDLHAFPTMAAVLGHPGPWFMDERVGLNARLVVHAEQQLTLDRPIPIEGTIRSRPRVTAMEDKGKKRGLMIRTEREGVDARSGDRIFTSISTIYCRGDGGSGISRGTTETPPPVPERAPDQVCELATLPQAALVYRLSGDHNPLHADPAVAAAAGFDRPILHGLCTFGIAGHAIVRTVCDYAPDRLTAISARFSAPFFPGETLSTEIWASGTELVFRARSLDRDVVVLDRGRAALAP